MYRMERGRADERFLAYGVDVAMRYHVRGKKNAG